MSGDCRCYLHGHLNCALHAPRHAYVHQVPSRSPGDHANECTCDVCRYVTRQRRYAAQEFRERAAQAVMASRVLGGSVLAQLDLAAIAREILALPLESDEP
jgi:hypothetical protein